MGRTLVLVVTLAVAAVLSTVAEATWSSPPGVEAWTADLRARLTKAESDRGPVAHLRPPALRGRAGPPPPIGDGERDHDRTGSRQPIDDERLEEIASPRTREAGAGPNADEAALLVLRSRRVRDLTWEEADLVQVVAYLRTVSDLDVYLTPAVGYVAFDDVEISLDLKDVTLEGVLDLVTEPYDLCWSVEDGRVKIATKDGASGALAIRYFDLKDLLPGVESFLGDSRFPPSEPPEPVVEQGIELERAVLDLIRETTGAAGAWQRPAVLETRNRILIARNDPQILERVGAFVEALIAEVEAVGGLDSYFETRRWSTVTGAPPRSLVR